MHHTGVKLAKAGCGSSARYYPAKSGEGCAAAMQLVLEDGGLRASLRKTGRERIAGREWSWDDYARRFVELCEATVRAE